MVQFKFTIKKHYVNRFFKEHGTYRTRLFDATEKHLQNYPSDSELSIIYYKKNPEQSVYTRHHKQRTLDKYAIMN